jgi:BirA family biotin operon repressor/biotin-[acetyl-CoA-carboxylase] ligase
VEECVDSTNTVLKNHAEDGAKEGNVIIAMKQTAGRGRLERKFYSPNNTGIYMSILFRPNLECEKATLFTTAAALAVAKAIRETVCYEANIKWVNDVLMDGKKVCGILTEGKIDPSSGKMGYVVLGIGINVMEPEGGFPDDISQIATSIVNLKDRKCDDDNLMNKLVAKILDNLYFYYNDVNLDEEFIRYEYIPFSSTLGKDINILDGDEIEEARAIGISENIGLIVKNAKGIRTLYSGEISIREK